MYKRLIFVFLLSLSVLFAPQQVSAQEASGPVYIVQSGDSLSIIALRFSVDLAELMSANGITDPNQLDAGQQLVIPGLDGITGVINTQFINFGDSFRSLTRRTQVPLDLFKKLNHIVSPSEFYVGINMIVPVQDGSQNLNKRISTGGGESLLEAAIKQNTDVWTIAHYNSLQGSWDVLPDDTLFAPGESDRQSASGLPSAFLSAEIRDLPIKQGGTGVIKVKTAPDVTLGGILVDHQLHFFSMEDGTQVAMQGVHSLLQPGIYPLRLDATLPDGSRQSYEQMVLIVSGNYPDAVINGVDPLTLDPKVIDAENQQVLSIVNPVTPETYWQAPFTLPVDTQSCIRAWYGERRSYNDGAYNNFHAGVDYGVCSEAHPFDAYAPAAGIIVFTGPVVVCGNMTIIDHGQGVYSKFCHQDEFYVTTGERVEAGQLVGKIGGTGRSNGPHLHWELWVNSVQVEPLDWLDQAYP
ncbi:MAG: peptidoglycan DD-metalloendopeptidase family protein [Chloroflexi bacterium]|nr:peptidoglycan DD-metalloendopeptidase family protein [Chloroflexota bacterium]